MLKVVLFAILRLVLLTFVFMYCASEPVPLATPDYTKYLNLQFIVATGEEEEEDDDDQQEHEMMTRRC